MTETIENTSSTKVIPTDILLPNKSTRSSESIISEFINEQLPQANSFIFNNLIGEIQINGKLPKEEVFYNQYKNMVYNKAETMIKDVMVAILKIEQKWDSSYKSLNSKELYEKLTPSDQNRFKELFVKTEKWRDQTSKLFETINIAALQHQLNIKIKNELAKNTGSLYFKVGSVEAVNSSRKVSHRLYKDVFIPTASSYVLLKNNNKKDTKVLMIYDNKVIKDLINQALIDTFKPGSNNIGFQEELLDVIEKSSPEEYEEFSKKVNTILTAYDVVSNAISNIDSNYGKKIAQDGFYEILNSIIPEIVKFGINHLHKNKSDLSNQLANDLLKNNTLFTAKDTLKVKSNAIKKITKRINQINRQSIVDYNTSYQFKPDDIYELTNFLIRKIGKEHIQYYLCDISIDYQNQSIEVLEKDLKVYFKQEISKAIHYIKDYKPVFFILNTKSHFVLLSLLPNINTQEFYALYNNSLLQGKHCYKSVENIAKYIAKKSGMRIYDEEVQNISKNQQIDNCCGIITALNISNFIKDYPYENLQDLKDKVYSDYDDNMRNTYKDIGKEFFKSRTTQTLQILQEKKDISYSHDLNRSILQEALCKYKEKKDEIIIPPLTLTQTYVVDDSKLEELIKKYKMELSALSNMGLEKDIIFIDKLNKKLFDDIMQIGTLLPITKINKAPDGTYISGLQGQSNVIYSRIGEENGNNLNMAETKDSKISFDEKEKSNNKFTGVVFVDRIDPKTKDLLVSKDIIHYKDGQVVNFIEVIGGESRLGQLEQFRESASKFINMEGQQYKEVVSTDNRITPILPTPYNRGRNQAQSAMHQNAQDILNQELHDKLSNFKAKTSEIIDREIDEKKMKKQEDNKSSYNPDTATFSQKVSHFLGKTAEIDAILQKKLKPRQKIITKVMRF